MKNNLRGLIAVLIALVILDVVVLVIPFVPTATFWVSYIFMNLALLVQLPVLYMSFRKENTPKSRFYGFPVAQVGVVYLVVQLIVCLICMLLSLVIPWWITLVVDLVLLGAACIGFIAVDAVRDEIVRQDEKLVKDVSAMRALQSKLGVLPGQCDDAEAAAALQKLAEELRYSDPVSSPATAPLEQELHAMADALQQAVVDGDREAVLKLCRSGMVQLAERNRICKLNKAN